MLTTEEAALYDSTVGVLLTQELWTDRDTYDTAHALMVPMHYAFAVGDMEKSMLLRLFLTALLRMSQELIDILFRSREF